MNEEQREYLCVNAIRMLCVDAVQRANIGHPGLPMGAAAMAHVLWTRFLNHHPQNPAWANRDRFVLSAGHGSMLLYSLLYLTGYELGLDELKAFRQWGSRTPGHPEYGVVPGVETTTGPLGQGAANAVGLALAAKHLAARFNRPGYPIVDHDVFALVSDGDLMEGLSHEAASLAGHLKLDNLIWLYDDNHITIEGGTELAFSEHVLERFEAYGWHTQRVAEGNDLEAIATALEMAKAQRVGPALIAIRTHIGYGSPHKQDSAAAHGAPLGEEEVRLTKQNLGWPSLEPFFVPQEVLDFYHTATERGAQLNATWDLMFQRYQHDHPALARQFLAALSGELPSGWESALPTFAPDDKPVATRKTSGIVLNAVAQALPTLLGGSADLAGSNLTWLEGCDALAAGQYGGRNLHFGVREHAMGGVLNGMALHGGLIPYGGTFLVFSDYMRPAMRLAAMMGQRVIYVLTHDSIGVGEDGPTHQPVEHLAALRAIPQLVVVRPADAAETAAAWNVALERQDGPTALVLTRQAVPPLQREGLDALNGVARGAYVVADAPGGKPDIVLMGTGSEVQLVCQARQQLVKEGVAARAISMPSWELFETQPQAYREAILPPEVPLRVSVEAGVSQGWERYVGLQGVVIGLDHFGASAPGDVVMERFGFTVEHVVARARTLLG